MNKRKSSTQKIRGRNKEGNAEMTHPQNDVRQGQPEKAGSEVMAETKQSLKSQDASKTDISFWLFIVLAFLLGTVLRLYLISEQILLDDEWHGMHYVIDSSFSYLLTHSGLHATSIPMNLYHRLLLRTLGWSELLLRLPALAAGVLGLVVFPVLAKKIFSRRVTIIFVFLLAISPFLIFYTRVCRPYSMVTLLGFLSVLALYFWATSGERRYAVTYVVAGVLAVYFHLFAAIAVLTPLGYVFMVKLIRKGQVRIVPSLRELIFAAVSIALVLSLLILPALIQSSVGTEIGADRMTLKSLVGFACMLSGTANKFMVVLFWGLLGFGQILVLRKMRLLGGIFCSVAILHFGALVIFSSDGIHAPIVISRYVTVLFPMSFVLVALGTDGILKYLQSAGLMKGRGYSGLLTNLIAAAFLAALFFAGPLIKLYTRPNNFTNHSAFQESYEPLTWEQSYTSDMAPGFIIKKADLPSFYQWLSGQPGTSTIIEYPMEIFDLNNLFYYYQHFHKKAVIAGYVTNPDIVGYTIDRKPPEEAKPRSRLTYLYPIPIDNILSRVPDTRKLAFRNMVDVMDIEALRQQPQADYIILHKTVWVAEVPHPDAGNKIPFYMSSKSVDYLNQTYRKSFGPPIFEDHNIIVFRISPAPTHK